MLFVRGAKRRAEEEAARESNTTEALYQELLTRGVHHQVARDIVERHETDRIRAKIEVYDWLLANSQENVLRNPAGYLVASIRDDYSDPDEYAPRLKKVRKKKGESGEELHQDEEIQSEEMQSDSEKPSGRGKSNANSNLNTAGNKTEEEEAKQLAQWQALPETLREEIIAAVNKQHKGLLQWPAMMTPMYLDEMTRRFGQNPPVAPLPSGISITEKLIAEEESEKPK